MGQSEKVRKRDGTEFTTYDMLYHLHSQITIKATAK